MKRIKQIPHPQLSGARPLSPLELNRIAYEERHSVLTPQRLESMAGRARDDRDADNGSLMQDAAKSRGVSS